MNGRPRVLRSSLCIKWVSKNGLWAEKCVDSREDTQIWFCQPLESRRTEDQSLDKQWSPLATWTCSRYTRQQLAAIRELSRHPVAYFFSTAIIGNIINLCIPFDILQSFEAAEGHRNTTSLITSLCRDFANFTVWERWILNGRSSLTPWEYQNLKTVYRKFYRQLK